MLRYFRKKLPDLMMALAMTAAGSVNAEDTAIQGNDCQIITDNFTLERRSPTASRGSKELLGSLGAYDVIRGTRAADHIAFVRKNDGRSYIIQNRIIVKCSRRTSCALPDELNAVKLTSRLYEVQVPDYATWRIRMAELKKIPGVIKVSGTYSHGLKPVQR
ncbi:MAG: hypothetical protein IJ523_12570 [Succinivibrionaceae bacterium]|nr:hypothetical protein [Succinivibrionaceae bacterium]